MANIALDYLRACRDKSQGEWDALLRSECGPDMLKLWDYLRAREDPTPPLVAACEKMLQCDEYSPDPRVADAMDQAKDALAHLQRKVDHGCTDASCKICDGRN